MSRTIDLTQGKVTIIDNADFEYVNQFKWFAKKSGTGDLWYAAREVKRITIWLHRVIAARANLPHSRFYDHRDRDGLNNRRGNIRPCTSSQNQANKRKALGKSSRFKGVSWNKESRKWTAHIRQGRLIYLGRYGTEEAAHDAYAAAATRHYGEFARP